MEHNFERLQDELGRLIDRLSVGEMARVTRKLAMELRRRNQQRMAQQQGPDGEAWAARKRSGVPRYDRQRASGKMMRRLRTNQFFKAVSDGEGLRLYFAADKIAARHHFGGSERLRFGIARYPARPLLGISQEDQELVLQALREQLGELWSS